MFFGGGAYGPFYQDVGQSRQQALEIPTNKPIHSLMLKRQDKPEVNVGIKIIPAQIIRINNHLAPYAHTALAARGVRAILGRPFGTSVEPL